MNEVQKLTGAVQTLLDQLTAAAKKDYTSVTLQLGGQELTFDGYDWAYGNDYGWYSSSSDC